MTNFNVVFDADSLVRTWVRSVVGYDVAINLMWQIPYTEGDHLT